MRLQLDGYVDLPEHVTGGGFDHAAIHHRLRRLYVAHTSNDAVDVIDLDRGEYAGSVEGLQGVAGALVDEVGDRVFTSNRGEDTVGIFRADAGSDVAKVSVGRRPNGLSFDPVRQTLLAANVGDPSAPETHTLSIVDVRRNEMVASVGVSGRTRWTVFDPLADSFFVNIADPSQIVIVAGANPTEVTRTIPVPGVGPHGLDVDQRGRLYCACDDGRLLVLEPPGYEVTAEIELAGSPDVIFLDRAIEQLFVAVGEPGVIQMVDVSGRGDIETVRTELGAHTLALDDQNHRVYVFMPETHRAAVFSALPL